MLFSTPGPLRIRTTLEKGIKMYVLINISDTQFSTPSTNCVYIEFECTGAGAGAVATRRVNIPVAIKSVWAVQF